MWWYVSKRCPCPDPLPNLYDSTVTRIALINHSDSRGGASVVTLRLARALAQAGVDTTMLVSHKATDDALVRRVAAPWRSKLSFLHETAHIAAGVGLDRDTVFKLSSGRAGLPLHRRPEVRGADAVLLNWVNQGMLSIDGIERLSRVCGQLIWTMHDMWCMTGACHHAGNCTAYTASCGNCPMIHDGRTERDLSRRTWLAKERLYRIPNLQFVAVSHWLADKAAESGLLGGKRVSVIPNAFPVDAFAGPAAYSRAELGLPADVPLIAMGAARLDDPIKNLPGAIQALNLLADRGVEAHAVLFGSIRQPELLEQLRLPHTALGPVSGTDRLQAIYAHADAVLSSSHYETLPGTLIEGQAAGALPVSYDRGGQADIIDHLRTGYLAPYGDSEALAQGLAWAIDPHRAADRVAAASSVADKFSAPAVARRYLELIKLGSIAI